MSKYSLKKVYENKSSDICKEDFIKDQEVIEEGLKDFVFSLASLFTPYQDIDAPNKYSNIQNNIPAITKQIEKEDEEIKFNLRKSFDTILNNKRETISFYSDSIAAENVLLSYKEILLLCFAILNEIDNDNQGISKEEIESFLSDILNESKEDKKLDSKSTPTKIGRALGHEPRLLSQSRQSGFLQGLVSEVADSANFDEFINNFFLFLYSKTVNKLNITYYNDKSRPTGKSLADIEIEADNLIQIFFNSFVSKIKKKQTKFTIFYGTFFEEVFEQKIQNYLSGDSSYLPTFSEKTIAGKKISIILILFKTGRFIGSNSYRDLISGSKISDNSYLEDYKTISESMIDRIDGLDSIIDLYSSILKIDKSEIICNDTEKDAIIKEYNDNGTIEMKSNLPFDYIIRQKNIGDGIPSNFGLFDLKAYNINSGSSILSQSKSGNNKNNSALKFINEVITSLKKKNNDIPVTLSFFGLIQVSYEIAGRGKDISFNITDIDYKTAPALDSFIYSQGRKHFYLAYTPEGYQNPKKIYDIDNNGNKEKRINGIKGTESIYINDSNSMRSVCSVSYAKHKNNITILRFIKNKLQGYSGDITDYIDGNNCQSILKNILLNSDFFKLINDIKSDDKTFEDIFLDENSDSHITDRYNLENLYNYIKNDEYFDPVTISQQVLLFLIEDFIDADEFSNKLNDLLLQQNKAHLKQNFKRALTRYLVSIYGKPSKNLNVYELNKDLDHPHQESKKPSEDLYLSKRSYNEYLEQLKSAINKKYIESYNEDVQESDDDKDIHIVASGKMYDKGNVIKEMYRKRFLNSFNYLYSDMMHEGIFHMMHPYEYHSSNEFKLGDLLEIINEIENGTLEASEKLDGQNLWFSFRDGHPVFAYNMKELQAGGVEWSRLGDPYEIQDKKDIPKDFSGLEKITRPHLRKDGNLVPEHGGYTSFKDGVEVIHHCLADAYSRDPELVESIFANGENFSSSEVIHTEGPNQILYGENFIAPHFVMDKSGEQYLDKYKLLFSLLKFEQDKVKNPKGFKLLTRAQRNTVASQIISFSDEQEKLDFVNELREEYQNRIQSLINNTSLTLENTIKDVHRYYLVEYVKSKGETKLANNEELINALLLFIHGDGIKESGLNKIPDYKKILTLLDLSNAQKRGAFKSSYIGNLVELFFDFGIDINRGIKTTAASDDSQRDLNHERIVITNLNNVKKAFVIEKAIQEEYERLVSLGQEEEKENRKLFLLARSLRFQISKVKSLIKRVRQRKGFSSNVDALTFIVSTSIEGLVLNRKIPDSDNVMELKLTGFFAPMNQIINGIKFNAPFIPMLQQFIEPDGEVFSLNNQTVPNTYDIESILERKLLKKLMLSKSNYSLLEMYNLKTYSETDSDEFDIGIVPMSAKPFTIGHEDLVKTACQRSKQVYIVISTTSRMRSYENPVTGNSMERIYFEGNPSGLVPELEILLNRNLPECKGKITVVYSKNPVSDVNAIFEEDFAYDYLEKDKRYCIFVGDKEDAESYSPEALSHMEDRLNVVYRDDDEERLSSGTRTRASLNTGAFTQEREVPIKSKPGQTKIERVVVLTNPHEEGSELYNQSFEEFADNLSNIYDMTQKKRIYDYISGESRSAIDDLLYALSSIDSNKEARQVLSKEEIKAMTALGGFKKAKQMSIDYLS